MDPLFLCSTRYSNDSFLNFDSYFFSALPDWIFSIKALLFTLILPASHTCVANQDKISTILGTIFNTFVVHQNREYSFWHRIYLRSASLPPFHRSSKSVSPSTFPSVRKAKVLNIFILKAISYQGGSFELLDDNEGRAAGGFLHLGGRAALPQLVCVQLHLL